MKIISIKSLSAFITGLFLIVLASCQPSSDGSSSKQETFSTPDAEAGSGSLSISSQVNIVEAQDDSEFTTTVVQGSDSLKLNIQSIRTVIGQAIDTGVFDATSDYNQDQTDFWVHEESIQAFNTVNEILCSIDQSKYVEMLGAGNYRAQIDSSLCSTDNDDASSAIEDSQNQSSSNTKTEYENWTVNSSRVTDQPHIIKVWIQETAEDDYDIDKMIMAKMEIYRSSTDDNPFGFFKMNFVGYQTDADGNADTSQDPIFKGYMKTVESTSTGDILLQFSNSGDFGGGQTFTEQATFRRAATGSSGSGTLKAPVWGDGPTPTEATFNIAYDASNFKRQQDSDTAQCYSRTEFDRTVWGYSMYDNAGARVELDSGFPIKYVSGTDEYYGWVGYHGLWMQDDANISNGDTVTKQDYNNGSETETDYTVFISGGRLIKHTRKSMDLGELKNVPLQWHDGTNNWQVKWTGSVLQKTATLDESNWTWTEITPQTIELNDEWGFGFWSEALGGSGSFSVTNVSGVYVAPSDSTTVNFHMQDMVYPTDTIPSTLLCFENCPDTSKVTDPTSTSLTYTDKAWEDSTMAPSAFTYHSYTFDSVNMVLKDGASNVVMSEQNTNFDWGFHSGILFDATTDSYDALACIYDTADTCNYQGWERLTEYYTWETGPEQWNKFTAIKDGGVFAKFDPPMKVKYTHAQTDTGAYDYKYNGTNFNLEYAGFGNLHGIPGKCIDKDTGDTVACDSDVRWIPEFNIKPGVTVVDVSDRTTEYVIKPLHVEQRMANVALTQCTDLSLTTYSLPGIGDWIDPDIGSKPVVTSAPAVIGGVLQ